MRIFGHHFHKNDNPWDEAPPWAVELRQIGLIILENQEKQMSDLAKLSADVDALTAAVATTATVLTGLSADIAALKAAVPPDNQAAVDDLAAKVEAATASLATATAANPA